MIYTIDLLLQGAIVLAIALDLNSKTSILLFVFYFMLYHSRYVMYLNFFFFFSFLNLGYFIKKVTQIYVKLVLIEYKVENKKWNRKIWIHDNKGKFENGFVISGVQWFWGIYIPSILIFMWNGEVYIFKGS